ncbi:MAG: PP0621 family protein [Candidatus Binatia bacterium]
MLRFVLFLILAYLIYRLIKSLWAAAGRSEKAPLRSAEDMVLDPQCQSYLPKNEALLRDGQYFCSENCARAFLSRSV